MSTWVSILGWGLIATAAMDLWSLFAKHILRTQTLSYGLVGRWLMGIPRGALALTDKRQPCSVAELAIGWGAHYVIGVALAMIFAVAAGDEWRHHPSPVEAVLCGIFTLALPFLVLQPAMGAGVAASKTPHPWASRARSAAAHIAFGLGLYVGARLVPLN